MSWIERTVGATRGALLGRLRRASRSVNELAAAMGITDNAVRTHLAAMQRDGMVQPAGVERQTGGKPAQLFEITPAAEEMYPKAYAYILGELIELLQEREGREGVETLLRAVGARAAVGVRSGNGNVESRVSAAAGVLRQLGGDVEVIPDESGWKIQGYGCPLSAVVGDHSELCQLVETLVAEVTGQPVQECCDRRGRPRCAFDVAASRSSTSLLPDTPDTGSP